MYNSIMRYLRAAHSGVFINVLGYVGGREAARGGENVQAKTGGHDEFPLLVSLASSLVDAMPSCQANRSILREDNTAHT